jgi:tetratricopeptide (TPR) repeat protein
MKWPQLLIFTFFAVAVFQAIADGPYFNSNSQPTKEDLQKQEAWLERGRIRADADYYEFQGEKKNDKGDFAGAIEDFSRAIPLNPKDVYSFWGRANARDHTGDLAGAMEDYTSAAALKPNDAYTYCSRGRDKMLTGDADGALADFNRALALDPKYAWTWYYRGDLHYMMRDWQGAIGDYRRACQLDKRTQDYPRLSIWLIRTRLGEKADANKEFSLFLAKRGPLKGGDWYREITDFFADTVSEADFLASSVSPDAPDGGWAPCSAWFYAGMKKLISGDTPAAIVCFRKCEETNRPDILEYHLAESELKTLEQPKDVIR